MEVIVRFHPSVSTYFNELIDILFYQGYFSYKESALNYVSKLIDVVENQIHKKKHNITPGVLWEKGRYYIHFNVNQNTTWYFIFEKRNNFYLITYVFNNYSKEAKELNF